MNIAESSVPDCSLLSVPKKSNIGNTGHNKTKSGTLHKLKIEDLDSSRKNKNCEESTNKTNSPMKMPILKFAAIKHQWTYQGFHISAAECKLK